MDRLSRALVHLSLANYAFLECLCSKGQINLQLDNFGLWVLWMTKLLVFPDINNSGSVCYINDQIHVSFKNIVSYQITNQIPFIKDHWPFEIEWFMTNDLVPKAHKRWLYFTSNILCAPIHDALIHSIHLSRICIRLITFFIAETNSI